MDPGEGMIVGSPPTAIPDDGKYVLRLVLPEFDEEPELMAEFLR